MPGETEVVATKDSAPVTDSTSKGEAGSTSKNPDTLTRAEHQKLLSDALAEAGRKHKAELEPIVKENSTLKSEITKARKEAETASTTLQETQEEIDSLKQDIESLSESNPDSAELVKLKRELRTAESQLKRDYKAKEDALEELKKTTEREREEFAGVVSEAQALKLAVDTFEVAEDFDGDAEKLKALCEDRIEATGKPMSREDIEKLAARIWEKKVKAEDTEPDLITDSGRTNGGKADTPTSVRTLYATSKIDAIEFQKRMKALGVQV